MRSWQTFNSIGDDTTQLDSHRDGSGNNSVNCDHADDMKERRPFDGQVCSECRPRLRRAYKIAMSLIVGVPLLIALICLAIVGD